MRAKKLIIIVVPVIILIVLLISWNYYRHSPQYSIKQIKESINKRQRVKFEQYVDVENLSKQAVDAFINQTMIQSLHENDGWGILGSALGNKLFESMKPTIISLLKTSIEESVENGNFQKLFTKSDSNKNISLDKMQNVFSINPNSFSGYNLETYNGFGILSLNFPSEIFDTILVIKLKFEDIGDYWKITGFDNLNKYLATIQSLENNNLNDKIVINRNKLDSLISFEQKADIKEMLNKQFPKSSSELDEYFNLEKNYRYESTIKRLKDIRKAEFAYKNVYEKFTGSWDTLISFVKHDKPLFVRKIAYPIELLKMVPINDTTSEFYLGATSIKTSSGTIAPVFEAKAHNNTILKGLDRQRGIKLNDDARQNGKYPGLKVGSLNEDNGGKGNWEE